MDLGRYYEEIGDWILTHVRGRPLTLVPCPAGVGGECVYMKHAKAWGPTALRRVSIQEKTKVGVYLVADTVSAVVVLARTNPSLFTTKFKKLGRERKILVDFMRNNRTNTSICAYSSRARPGAHVSTPIDWSELRTPPERWTLTTVRQRLRRIRIDPWHGYWKTKQQISKATMEAVRHIGP